MRRRVAELRRPFFFLRIETIPARRTLELVESSIVHQHVGHAPRSRACVRACSAVVGGQSEASTPPATVEFLRRTVLFYGRASESS